MEGAENPSSKLLWFLLGTTVLVLGGAFFLGSLFLEALGWTYYAPNLSLVGIVFMLVGVGTAVAAIRV